MKHYEFTGETMQVDGITLHRIRATRDIECNNGVVIHKGNIGGWIEKEENLTDNAWVFENARVYGNSWVYGNAWVCGNAEVFGNSKVYGDARVYGNSWVYENSWVYGNAEVFGNARVYGEAEVSGNSKVYGEAEVSGNSKVYGNARVGENAKVQNKDHFMTVGQIGSRNDTTTFFLDKSGGISVCCGCFTGTLDEFRAKVRETHGGNKHGRVYLLAAELAELQITNDERVEK